MSRQQAAPERILLAAACFAIAVMASASNRAIAATETPSADTSTTSCPHQLNKDGTRWKPADSELHLILARHFGYWFRKTQPDLDLQNADDASLKDAYLDRTVPDWRKEARKNPEKANLCNAELGGAHLEGADLVNAELSLADLEGAHLRGADLKGAVLRGADLKGAILVDADLKGADLEAAVLNGADLTRAILVDADLKGADLKGAVLRVADLNGADLFRASLSSANLSAAKVGKAKLGYADLTGATYGPASEPPDPYVAGIKGLATLTTPYGEQIGLVQLRKLLRDAGLEEDEVTSSIQRNRTGDQLSTISSQFWSFAWIEGVLRYVGFGLTTAYGLYPEGALAWILLLGILLTPVYMRVMLHPTQTSRIIQVFPKDRVDIIDTDSNSEQPRMKVTEATSLWSALRWASYLSLLSAVNIGFQQFTPGDWIRRLQGRDYSLQPVGWARTVAGAQALISVYLLAMWALTQFGRPFG